MRDFTEEEKEKIISTPITMDCFDFGDLDTENVNFAPAKAVIGQLETLRFIAFHAVPEEKDNFFKSLLYLLPNSYKVVKL